MTEVTTGSVPMPDRPAVSRLTPAQLEAVSGGGLYGTEYWIKGEIFGDRAWVYDAVGNCVGEFATSGAAHRWIRGMAGTAASPGAGS